MERIEAGMFVRSKAGHDKGELYIIAKAEKEYAYIMDGKGRTFEKPKRKNLKHLQVIRKIPPEWSEKCINGEPVTDEDIRRAIKQYLKEEQPGQPNSE